jgi:hypothetical protein
VSFRLAIDVWGVPDQAAFYVQGRALLLGGAHRRHQDGFLLPQVPEGEGGKRESELRRLLQFHLPARTKATMYGLN